jgi:hypothetical protein
MSTLRNLLAASALAVAAFSGSTAGAASPTLGIGLSNSGSAEMAQPAYYYPGYGRRCFPQYSWRFYPYYGWRYVFVGYRCFGGFGGYGGYGGYPYYW